MTVLDDTTHETIGDFLAVKPEVPLATGSIVWIGDVGTFYNLHICTMCTMFKYRCKRLGALSGLMGMWGHFGRPSRDGFEYKYKFNFTNTNGFEYKYKFNYKNTNSNVQM